MQTLKLRTVLNLSAIKQEFVRNVAVSTAAVQANENVSAIKSWKDIPGPSALPVIGQLLHFMPGGQFHNVNGVELSDLLNKTYGPIVRLDRLVGRPALILLFDAEGSSQILRGENSMPIRPGFKSLEYYRKQHNKTKGQSKLPTGLVTDHGTLWKSFRSAVNPVMLQPKTIKLYTTAIDEVAQDMIKRMKSLRDENGVLNAKFDDEINLWALESIAIVALGCRLNCLDLNLPKDSPAMKLIQCVHDFFITADKLDFKPSIWKYIATPTFKKAMKFYEDQENVAKYFVRQGVEQLKKYPTKSDEQKGVLEKLLHINEEYAYIMASDMLFSGIDTASNTVTATLYLLAKNPEKQEILREEVFSKKDKRPYLRACIKESFRVMPVVSGNIRLTTKEYNILGYQIPKDIHVTFGHQHMSLMETYYPRAKEFIPERWLAEKTDPLYHGNTHPFAYAPFGFGVRSCIGRRIAELEIETFLTRVIENFKVEWVGPPPHVHQTTLNYTKGPFNFIFKDV
ncbi:hypothetical protein K1T71_004908 [Dendrolimus kikuchii]|uniref:Uncharacterized protein n=1 Tax=Dendrolimus kikuchii TaxID=765133 RepID=A0ACC1D5V5_9NEOP|nr:hypothetical protein K1T71_004908 [Dendrolimus kikuchii]